MRRHQQSYDVKALKWYDTARIPHPYQYRYLTRVGFDRSSNSVDRYGLYFLYSDSMDFDAR